MDTFKGCGKPLQGGWFTLLRNSDPQYGARGHPLSSVSDTEDGNQARQWATFGDRLAWARNRKGWKQEDLAEKVGSGRKATVSGWEGGSTPGLEYLEKLPGLLGVDTKWLLTGEGDPEPMEESEAALRVRASRWVLTEAKREELEELLRRDDRSDAERGHAIQQAGSQVAEAVRPPEESGQGSATPPATPEERQAK